MSTQLPRHPQDLRIDVLQAACLAWCGLHKGAPPSRSGNCLLPNWALLWRASSPGRVPGCAQQTGGPAQGRQLNKRCA
jgi:hypothetical protein